MQPKQLTGPSIFHLELNEGMDHLYEFTYVDQSTLLPIDLTGWKADLYMTYTTGHPQVLKAISSYRPSIEGSITLGANGLISISFFGQFTYNLNWSDAVYDLVLTSTTERKVKLLRGKVNVYDTIAFPANYTSTIPQEALILTVGYASLPNGADLWGYMNPIALGVGGGLYLTGSLRPTLYNNMEIAELSYSSGHLRIAILGNVPDNTFATMSIGSTVFDFTTSDGRVFTEGAANGVGLTYWEWTGGIDPFGGIEGVTLVVVLNPTVV